MVPRRLRNAAGARLKERRIRSGGRLLIVAGVGLALVAVVLAVLAATGGGGGETGDEQESTAVVVEARADIPASQILTVDDVHERELGRVLSEMRIGKTKRESLREMCGRCGVDDLDTFVGAVVQADQLGVAITQVVRAQADATRVRRRQRAQELAQKAPIKMLFPMALLIFPALYVVILGTAIPRLASAFGGG